MTPLRVTAHMSGPVRLPYGWLALDALLAAAICRREGVAPVSPGEPLTDLSPWLSRALARSDCGRFWLASFSVGEVDQHEKRWLRTVSVAAGPMKALHMAGDRLDWYAVGDTDVVRELLTPIVALGAKRNAGDGAVGRWDVAPCEPWAGGFPVVLDGMPLRPLPFNWDGVDPAKSQTAWMALNPPYWPHDSAHRVDVLVPVR